MRQRTMSNDIAALPTSDCSWRHSEGQNRFPALQIAHALPVDRLTEKSSRLNPRRRRVVATRLRLYAPVASGFAPCRRQRPSGNSFQSIKDQAQLVQKIHTDYAQHLQWGHQGTGTSLSSMARRWPTSGFASLSHFCRSWTEGASTAQEPPRTCHNSPTRSLGVTVLVEGFG